VSWACFRTPEAGRGSKSEGEGRILPPKANQRGVPCRHECDRCFEPLDGVTKVSVDEAAVVRPLRGVVPCPVTARRLVANPSSGPPSGVASPPPATWDRHAGSGPSSGVVPGSVGSEAWSSWAPPPAPVTTYGLGRSGVRPFHQFLFLVRALPRCGENVVRRVALRGPVVPAPGPSGNTSADGGRSERRGLAGRRNRFKAHQSSSGGSGSRVAGIRPLLLRRHPNIVPSRTARGGR